VSFSVKVDLAALDLAVDGLEQKLQESARPAAQAGAEILYQAVMRNVQAMGRKTGNLAASIYQAYSTHDSEPHRPVYHVSWNPRKAPHAYLVEFGHIQKYKVYVGSDGNWYTNKNAPLPAPVQVAARPFIRPAMALFPRAEQAMVDRLLEGIA
jgi:hypothetical protein